MEPYGSKSNWETLLWQISLGKSGGIESEYKGKTIGF